MSAAKPSGWKTSGAAAAASDSAGDLNISGAAATVASMVDPADNRLVNGCLVDGCLAYSGLIASTVPAPPTVASAFPAPAAHVLSIAAASLAAAAPAAAVPAVGRLQVAFAQKQWLRVREPIQAGLEV